MLGAIVGDVAGSSYESCLQKFSDPSKITLFMATSRFTDDSVMTLAVARWLTDSRDKSAASLVEAMQKLGRKYPNAGYGPAFARWLAADNPKPYGSWGNGAAMRVSPAGLYATTFDEALRLATVSAEVSHDHPEAVGAARAVAAAVFMARHGAGNGEIRTYVENSFGYDLSRTIGEIRPGYAWDVSCRGSVPEAITAFLDADSVEQAVRLAISLGGDADTQAAIAASMAAARWPVPDWMEQECRRRLTPELAAIIDSFEGAAADRAAGRATMQTRPGATH